ncbi:hypothetical protein [Algoriphagus namhaensis]
MENNPLVELAEVITEDLYFLPEDYMAPQPSTSEIKQETSPPHKTTEQPTVDSAAEEQAPEPKAPIQVKGAFKQRILVIHEEQELANEVLELLSNILKAVNHSMSDVGLISSYDLSDRSMEDLYELNAHKIIKFGRIKHSVNAVPAQDYQVHSDGETEYLFADALTTIQEDKALKGKLWKALQNLFNITK